MGQASNNGSSNCQEYEAVSPEGERIKITGKLFRALRRAVAEKADGGIHVVLHNGGIADVELQWRMK